MDHASDRAPEPTWRELVIEPSAADPASSPARARSAEAPYFSDFTVAERAERLLDMLVTRLVQGTPVVVSYRRAHTMLSGEPGPLPPEREAACARWLVRFSTGTRAVAVGRLGPVTLDSFLVEGATRRPGADHWARVHYDADEWAEVFGQAKLWELNETALARASIDRARRALTGALTGLLPE